MLYSFEEFSLDTARRELRRSGALISVQPQVFDLIEYLIRNRERVVSRDDLLAAVWNGRIVSESTLSTRINAARSAIGDSGEEQRLLRTAHGKGIRFVGAVREEEETVPGLAAPGGICVSGAVRDHIGARLPYAFEDMGEQAVKNIARPVRAYALRPDVVTALPTAGLPARPSRGPRAIIGTVAAAALAVVCLAWWFWPAATFFSEPEKPAAEATASSTPMSAAPAPTVITQPAAAPRLSIVVLPFTNLGNDPDQQYFADGITEDLTTDLSRIADMFVISRNTAFTYRNKPVDSKQIGRELGVRYLLEGSVRRSGNQVRVNAQLIDAETDAHLWAERFDRDTGDLFALQNEITSRIAVALKRELVVAEATRPNDHPEALGYIFRGRAALMKSSAPDNLQEALAFFERALALDPGSPTAQSWLARALVARAPDPDETTDSSAGDIARAEELVNKALASSPRSPLAHYARGTVLRAQDRFEEAIPEYETAIAADRNWLDAYAHLGQCKFYMGSIEEYIPLVGQAVRLSPRDPLIGVWFGRIGLAHLLQSRIDDALHWLERARNANPELTYVHSRLASAYALKGEAGRAAAELAQARKLRGGDRYSSIARLRAEYLGVPKIRALFEATYLTGLRKAGMPEE